MERAAGRKFARFASVDAKASNAARPRSHLPENRAIQACACQGTRRAPPARFPPQNHFRLPTFSWPDKTRLFDRGMSLFSVEGRKWPDIHFRVVRKNPGSIPPRAIQVFNLKSLMFRLVPGVPGYFGVFRKYPGKRQFPGKNGAAGGGRTHNLRLRRPTLYPVELRLHLKRVGYFARGGHGVEGNFWQMLGRRWFFIRACGWISGRAGRAMFNVERRAPL